MDQKLCSLENNQIDKSNPILNSPKIGPNAMIVHLLSNHSTPSNFVWRNFSNYFFFVLKSPQKLTKFRYWLPQSLLTFMMGFWTDFLFRYRHKNLSTFYITKNLIMFVTASHAKHPGFDSRRLHNRRDWWHSPVTLLLGDKDMGWSW